VHFTNKVCSITGATSGIGRATALQMAREGDKIVAVGRDAAEGKQVAAELKKLGGEVLFIKANVGLDRQLARAVRKALARWGRIDALVNDAAMMTTLF
jgi:glucose 1-dehydrogenase